MKEIKVNQGELLKELLRKNNSVEVLEVSTIKERNDELLVLEKILINKKLEIVIVSDTSGVVVVT